MPDVILRILSIIGILLLILLGLMLLSMLLLLFWPVTYRVRAEKDADRLKVTARADWLFGVLRVRYAYPEPGTAVVRLLWKTLADTGQKRPEPEEEQKAGKAAEKSNPKSAGQGGEGGEIPEAAGEGGEGGETPEAAGEGGREEETPEAAGTGEEEETPEPGRLGPFSHILEKIRNIKYTILNIYDKIKEIWANISYYSNLLREENTALLWGHVKLRVGKILKNIRPRHIRANLLFGTGAPDTTGYLFGIYGMLLPLLGKAVCVTPDFNRAVLEGTADVSGHITVWTLGWNALKLLLDKKLKLFIKKMKAGRKGNGR